MHNNRLDRLLYIQQILVQGSVLSKQQTADRFGVSEKTIQRYRRTAQLLCRQ